MRETALRDEKVADQHNRPTAQPRQMWPEVLERIRERLSSHSFETWFRTLACFDGGPDHIVLAVPSKFHLDWVTDHYLAFVREEVEKVCGREVDVRLEVAPEHVPEIAHQDEEAGPADQSRARAQAGSPSSVCRLNQRYTFDRFVTGPSNQFARAACEAVAENPAKAYNPLFIYGGVGLGKTHLLHAIGLRVGERDPSARVVYVTCEAFMNDLIDSMRHERMASFRDRYRNQCDLLLVDDIQFLSGKERTQEEFFHTFNALYESQRQIVITSDKFPHEIPGIEERLRSRFQSGLIADIQPPEMETRLAILRAMAESEAIDLPDEVALLLATHITSNVRELEGALIRLHAYASLTKQPITLELAKEQLRGLVKESERKLSADDVQKVVASYFGVKVSDLKGQRRHRAVSLPRQVAMYLCRKHCGMSYPEIGDRFGGKDHTTVMAAVRKITQQLDSDLELRNSIAAIERTLWA